jgi:hypothetical protein
MHVRTYRKTEEEAYAQLSAAVGDCLGQARVMGTRARARREGLKGTSVLYPVGSRGGGECGIDFFFSLQFDLRNRRAC